MIRDDLDPYDRELPILSHVNWHGRSPLNLCPNAEDCGEPLLNADETGAECGFCGQRLTRYVLVNMYAGAPV